MTGNITLMKFVDEAKIYVEAGKGGNGACSFLRLKFMPFGGPDGRWRHWRQCFLKADESINTLVDYRYIRSYKAEKWRKGFWSELLRKKRSGFNFARSSGYHGLR